MMALAYTMTHRKGKIRDNTQRTHRQMNPDEWRCNSIDKKYRTPRAKCRTPLYTPFGKHNNYPRNNSKAV